MKFRKIIFGSAIGIALLIGAVVSQSQTQFTELYDIMFRPGNPQIRVVGTAEFRDQAGTASGKVKHSQGVFLVTAATKTLTFADCGALQLVTATSGTVTFTLPAVGTSDGCVITLVAAHAGSEILVDAAVAATDCTFSTHSAIGTDADTAVVSLTSCGTTGAKNTAATNTISDTLKLVSDGTQWVGVGFSTGVWASQ